MPSSVYECEGYRLPTSGEWEYAARAGTSTPVFTGAMTPETKNCVLEPGLALTAWYCANVPENPRRTEQRVALLERNAWGLYDVIGNVSEWVSDDFGGVGWYDPYPDPEGQITNATMGTTRGCAFFAPTWTCRVAMKLPTPRDERNAGFRLVRTLGIGTPPTLDDVDEAQPGVAR